MSSNKATLYRYRRGFDISYTDCCDSSGALLSIVDLSERAVPRCGNRSA
jgi:hypothetical protein